MAIANKGFEFPMDQLQGLIQRRVNESSKSAVAAVGDQIYFLASKLHELWKKLVTKEQIRKDMQASVDAGRGYKRKMKKYNGSSLKVALGTGSTTLVAASLAQSGKNWKAFLKRNLNLIDIEAFNRIRTTSYTQREKRGEWFMSKKYSYDFKRAKPGEIQKIMFEAELKRRQGRIGYQASGWLPGVWKFSKRSGAGKRTVQYLRDKESWADASGRKTVAKFAPGRVLERWSGVHRYEVAIVNFANGIKETDAKHGIVEHAIALRRADILNHLKAATEDGLAGDAKGAS